MKATKFLSICSMVLALMGVAPALALEEELLTQEDQEEKLLKQEQEKEDLVGVESAGCFSTHTSGSGSSLMTICISNHGNLLHFESPAFVVHTIGAEGYMVCSGDGSVRHGYDAGFDEDGFGMPTISQPNGPNTFPLTITRITTDGVFRLQQTFAWDTAEKDVTVTMKLTNRSSTSRSAV